MAEVLEMAEGSSTDYELESAAVPFLVQMNTTMHEICTSYNVSILEQLSKSETRFLSGIRTKSDATLLLYSSENKQLAAK